jgi:uncharacterized repeat protein (TIGR02543 family)
MKKIIFVSLALAVALSMFGCSEPQDDGPFTISFNWYYYDAPPAPNSISLKSNEKIGDRLPSPVESDGFIFLGWFRYTSDGKWKQVGANDTFSASTTLYAHWEEYLSIAFNLNYLFAPESPNTIVLSPNESIGNKLPPDPAERAGFTFLGWFSSPSGGTKVTGDDTFNANATLYAQWQDNRPDITISFDMNYEGAPEPPPNVILKSGDMITYLNLPAVTRIGLWRFRGWSTAEGERVTRTTTFTGSTVLYAGWAETAGFSLDITDYYKGTSSEEFYGGAYGAPAEYSMVEVEEEDGSHTPALFANFPEPNSYNSNGHVIQGMFINLKPDQKAAILALPATTKIEVVLDAYSIPTTTEFRYFVGANPTLGENWNTTVASATGTLSAIANQTVSFSNANRERTLVCFFLQLRGQNIAPTRVYIKSVSFLWEKDE